MATKYQSFPGMEDLLPGEIEKWQWLEEKTRVFFETKGYREIRTPILEPTELFLRSIGETTDIVHKEMYTFEDRGGRQMTMRPEMTAAVARSVVEHHLLRNIKSLPLYYVGPMFRAERPQAGRKRQFHQIGAELIGSEDIVNDDLALACLVYDFLTFLGSTTHRLRLNDLTMMNGESGEKVRHFLRDYFESRKESLDKDSLFRLDKNVLRILDSKDPKTQEVVAGIPWEEMAPLGESFHQVVQALEARGVRYEIERRLVRGLDYYTGFVFEVVAEGLGAQDAVAGGGRYDHLYEEIGGKSTPCTGFSIGMERLLMVLEKQDLLQKQLRLKSIYFAPLSQEAEASAESTALQLRSLGFSVHVGASDVKIADHIKKANKMSFRFVAIKGEEEIANQIWLLKYMEQKDQKPIKEGDLIPTLLKEILEEGVIV